MIFRKPYILSYYSRNWWAVGDSNARPMD